MTRWIKVCRDIVVYGIVIVAANIFICGSFVTLYTWYKSDPKIEQEVIGTLLEQPMDRWVRSRHGFYGPYDIYLRCSFAMPMVEIDFYEVYLSPMGRLQVMKLCSKLDNMIPTIETNSNKLAIRKLRQRMNE